MGTASLGLTLGPGRFFLVDQLGLAFTCSFAAYLQLGCEWRRAARSAFAAAPPHMSALLRSFVA